MLSALVVDSVKLLLFEKRWSGVENIESRGVVHVGFLVFDIQENGDYTWWPELARLESQKVEVLKY